MRRRFQKPKIKNQGGYWIAQFRDLEGRKKKVSLGPVSRTKKYDAEARLAKILEPLNTGLAEASGSVLFGAFIRQVYLPFYERKWKASTAACNRDRLRFHLTTGFEDRPLQSFTREGLQQYLDDKARSGLSQSVVGHLRWDLRQIFRMAVSEGCLLRNPAELLFVPREARRYEKRRLNLEEVKLYFSVLAMRERVIAGLSLMAGMRPGEIFALRCADVDGARARIHQRVYRGQIDTPKTVHSNRWAALGDGLCLWLREWLDWLPAHRPEDWLFPSEQGGAPIRKDNCWRRNFLPRLTPVGLSWANFQVLRRSHASLMADLGVDPQVRADQMGHSVDVNQNQYTQSSLERRRSAVNALEKTLGLR